MNLIYRSDKDKEAFHSFYNQQLDKITVSFELKRIETSFGLSTVIRVGQKSKPVLLLLHHRFSSAPWMLAEFESLVSNYQLIAVDYLGWPFPISDRSLKLQSRFRTQWLIELMSHLNLKNVDIIGWELGLETALELKDFDNRKVRRIYGLKVHSKKVALLKFAIRYLRLHPLLSNLFSKFNIRLKPENIALYKQWFNMISHNYFYEPKVVKPSPDILIFDNKIELKKTILSKG